MSKYYSKSFLKMLRNEIPINSVIENLLNLEVRNTNQIFQFQCPQCFNFHTATNPETNLARCFDCEENFNPIDLVMSVENCNFIDAVESLKEYSDQ